MPVSSLRKHYIEIGAIRPDAPTVWESVHTTLRLDSTGRDTAQNHIYEYEYNKYFGIETEFPQEQLPECVLQYWEEHGVV